VTIPIPSGSPGSLVLDFHRNDLVSPPNPPTVVENVLAVDPRVALSMPMPVANTPESAASKDALLSNQANNAVLLEMSSSQTQQQTALEPMLAQSLSRMESLGSLALGELLSNTFLNQPANLGAQVDWPGNLVNDSTSASFDPKLVMSALYRSLENSGIFAADQLKKLLMPAGSIDEAHPNRLVTLREQASGLFQQISLDNPSVKDAIHLLLRGDLVWQGQLMPNIQAKIYRSDAWEAYPQNKSQLLKGSRLLMEINLQNIGKIEIIGTQFGDQVNIQITAGAVGSEFLKPQIENLIKEMQTQIDTEANVSLLTAQG